MNNPGGKGKLMKIIKPFIILWALSALSCHTQERDKVDESITSLGEVINMTLVEDKLSYKAACRWAEKFQSTVVDDVLIKIIKQADAQQLYSVSGIVCGTTCLEAWVLCAERAEYLFLNESEKMSEFEIALIGSCGASLSTPYCTFARSWVERVKPWITFKQNRFGTRRIIIDYDPALCNIPTKEWKLIADDKRKELIVAALTKRNTSFKEWTSTEDYEKGKIIMLDVTTPYLFPPLKDAASHQSDKKPPRPDPNKQDGHGQ
jgi:hypothetical protein